MKSDTVISLQPYFKMKPGKKAEFMGNLVRFCAKTQKEEGMVFYNFAVQGDVVICREGYKDGESVLAHLAHVDDELKEALEIADLIQFQVIGPPAELAKVREALTPLGAEFFELQTSCGGVRA